MCFAQPSGARKLRMAPVGLLELTAVYAISANAIFQTLASSHLNWIIAFGFYDRSFFGHNILDLRLGIWCNYHDLRRGLGLFFVGNDDLIAHFFDLCSVICVVGQ